MTAIPPMLTVHIPLTVRRRGGRKVVISPDGTEAPVITAARIDSTLVKALARAFRWRRMLEGGVVSTVGEIATREKINKSYVSRVLRLTLLAPAIVEAILDGRQAEGVTLPRLLGGVDAVWSAQRYSHVKLPHRAADREERLPQSLDTRAAWLDTNLSRVV